MAAVPGARNRIRPLFVVLTRDQSGAGAGASASALLIFGFRQTSIPKGVARGKGGVDKGKGGWTVYATATLLMAAALYTINTTAADGCCCLDVYATVADGYCSLEVYTTAAAVHYCCCCCYC